MLFTVQMMNKRSRFCTLTFKADLHSQVYTTVSVTSSASRSYRVLHSSCNWPITGQYSGQVTSIDQSQSSIHLTVCLLTRWPWSPVSWLARSSRYSDCSSPCCSTPLDILRASMVMLCLLLLMLLLLLLKLSSSKLCFRSESSHFFLTKCIFHRTLFVYRATAAAEKRMNLNDSVANQSSWIL